MAKKPVLKLPAPQTVEHVLRAAYLSPQPNCEVAQTTIAAINEVAAFFAQMRSQTGGGSGSTTPQASAN